MRCEGSRGPGARAAWPLVTDRSHESAGNGVHGIAQVPVVAAVPRRSGLVSCPWRDGRRPGIDRHPGTARTPLAAVSRLLAYRPRGPRCPTDQAARYPV